MTPGAAGASSATPQRAVEPCAATREFGGQCDCRHPRNCRCEICWSDQASDHDYAGMS